MAKGGGGTAQSQLSITARAPDTLLAERLNTNLDRFSAEALQQPDVVNTALLLNAPRQQYRYLRAQGLANPQTGEAMTTAQPFRVASISKVFTATVVLQ